MEDIRANLTRWMFFWYFNDFRRLGEWHHHRSPQSPASSIRSSKFDENVGHDCRVWVVGKSSTHMFQMVVEKWWFTMVEIPKITLNMLKHTQDKIIQKDCISFVQTNSPETKPTPPFPKQPYESLVTLPKKKGIGCVFGGSPKPPAVTWNPHGSRISTSWPLSSAFQGRDWKRSKVGISVGL